MTENDFYKIWDEKTATIDKINHFDRQLFEINETCEKLEETVKKKLNKLKYFFQL